MSLNTEEEEKKSYSFGVVNEGVVFIVTITKVKVLILQTFQLPLLTRLGTLIRNVLTL